jgi:hypothetical protein
VMYNHENLPIGFGGFENNSKVVIHSFLHYAANPSFNAISILGQTQASIRATKPETVGESHLHIMVLGVLGHVVAVKVLCRITRLLQIESRRHHTLRWNCVSRWTSKELQEELGKATRDSHRESP